MLDGRRILVVEDDEAERMLISLHLQRQGCRIFHAQDGLDGIHKARLMAPDAILMDLDMPRCDGFAACRVLREDPSTANVPVIFLSAYQEPEQRVQGLLAGAVDYIGKPFNFDEVQLRLAVHLRRGVTPPARPINEANNGAADADPAHLYNILFHSARVHLLKSLAQAPDLQELAALVGTNTKRLNEAFRYCAGTTVFEYLREERMKEAWQLLRHTSMPVGEVARRVGFSGSANFATAFKERYGTNPSRVRQEA